MAVTVAVTAVASAGAKSGAPTISAAPAAAPPNAARTRIARRAISSARPWALSVAARTVLDVALREALEELQGRTPGASQPRVGDPDPLDLAMADLQHPAARAVGRQVPPVEADVEPLAAPQPSGDFRQP